MSEKAPPTYDEMKRERAEEWTAAQQQAAATLGTLHAALAAMPDVKHAPSPGDPWTHPDVVCPCGQSTFTVRRWNTINGLRYRTEVACVVCHEVGTWDWLTSRWCA